MEHPDLRAIARQAMQAHGFIVQFPIEVQQQLKAEVPPSFDAPGVRDLTSWLWSSIDNDDSRDLDQLEYVKEEAGGIRIYVGIADVDSFVPQGSAIDQAAAQNTTSVYTGIAVFPMLPEKLSTDLSSLNEGVRRLAVVAEILVAGDGPDAGRIMESSVYSAVVQNKAQLSYNAVAAWLDGSSNPGPAMFLEKIRRNPDLQAQLTIQDKVAGLLRDRRHESGALTLRTPELHPVVSADGTVTDLQARRQDRASFLIEDFMIAANQATATFLDQHALPSIRRVVRIPERWDRIRTLAAGLGGNLTAQPDPKSLEMFLQQQLLANPARFADLSLSIIKLLGRGEYVVKLPDEAPPLHFGLAVNNYQHSTAPNRRYADLLTQRLVKAGLAGKSAPYSGEELKAHARHCTEREDEANKVERLMKKAEAATLLFSRIGETFDAVVAGASAEATWVRLSHPPIEGKLVSSFGRLDVGSRLKVRLISVDPRKGFIDFEQVQNSAR